jgi:hypothetical protein
MMAEAFRERLYAAAGPQEVFDLIRSQQAATPGRV